MMMDRKERVAASKNERRRRTQYLQRRRNNLNVTPISKTLDQWPSLSSTLECSPSELMQCVSMGISFVQWAVPGLSSDQALLTLKASSRVDIFEEQLASLCLIAVAHLRDELPWAAGGLHRIFKAPILSSMKEALNTLAAATSLSTIAILGSLANFETASNTYEARVHLQGISSILAARGGLEYLGFGGGLRKYLEFVDLIWAVKNVQSPIYSDSILPLLPPMSEVYKMATAAPRPGEFDSTYFCRPSLAWQWSHLLGYKEDDDILGGLADRKSEVEPLYLLQEDKYGLLSVFGACNPTPPFSQVALQWALRLRRVTRRKQCNDELSLACRLAARLIGAEFGNHLLSTKLFNHLQTMDYTNWNDDLGSHIRVCVAPNIADGHRRC